MKNARVSERMEKRTIFLLLGVLVVVIIAWQLTVQFLGIPSFLLPSPSEIVNSFFTGRFDWVQHSLITLNETVSGFAISIVVGISLALLISYSKTLSSIVYPYIVALQVLPKTALAPIFLVWFGFGILSKIMMSFLISFFPIVIDTATGLMSTSPESIELMHSLKASNYDIYKEVRIPAALPSIFAGLKVGITLAVIGAIVGELVGADKGLGYLIVLSSAYLDTPTAFAALIILMVMGGALYLIISLIERATIGWYIIPRREKGI